MAQAFGGVCHICSISGDELNGEAGAWKFFHHEEVFLQVKGKWRLLGLGCNFHICFVHFGPLEKFLEIDYLVCGTQAGRDFWTVRADDDDEKRHDERFGQSHDVSGEFLCCYNFLVDV